MKRLFILILLLTSMGSFAQKKLVLKVPAVASGGGGASSTTALSDVSDAAPANNSTLVYNQDSAKYVPTATAAYNFTDLRDGQYLSYDSLNSQWINVDAPTGGGTGDTIYYAASVPSEKKKNGWFNTSNHHFYILNDEGTHYIGYAPADSIAIGTTGGGDTTEINPFDTKAYTENGAFVRNLNGSFDDNIFGGSGEAKAQSGYILPSTNEGYYKAGYFDVSIQQVGEIAIIGLDATDGYGSWTGSGADGFDFGIYAYNGGIMTIIDGAQTNSGVTPQDGDEYGLFVEGNSVIAKYYRGGTWTTIATLGTRTTDLYLKAHLLNGGSFLGHPKAMGVE